LSERIWDRVYKRRRRRIPKLIPYVMSTWALSIEEERGVRPSGAQVPKFLWRKEWVAWHFVVRHSALSGASSIYLE
jgi:hypothetical protein